MPTGLALKSVAIISLALLGACGGGGGGSQGVVPSFTVRANPTPDGVLQVSPAADGATWAYRANTAYQIGSTVFLTGLNNVYGFLGSFDSFPVGTVARPPVACAVGGFVQLTYRKLSALDITVGDYAQYNYTNCNYTGEIRNGSVKVTFTGFSADTGSVAAVFEATGFGVSYSDVSWSFSGITGNVSAAFNEEGSYSYSTSNLVGRYDDFGLPPQPSTATGRENGVSATISHLTVTSSAGGVRYSAMDADVGAMFLKADVNSSIPMDGMGRGQVRVLRPGYLSVVRVNRNSSSLGSNVDIDVNNDSIAELSIPVSRSMF